jgi:ribosomal protein S18
MTRKIVFKTIDQEKIIKGMTYLSESERIQIEDKLNSDIGINEHVSPDTINRYIREIYKIQTEMIHALNVKNQD